MELTLVYDNGKPVGYIFKAESPEEQDALKLVQNMHFLASNKQERIQYDGVCTDKNNKVVNMHFLQRRFAILPPESELKQELLKCSLQPIAIKNEISAKRRIIRMLENHGLTYIDFDEHYSTDRGYITGCGMNGVDYLHEGCECYEKLDDDTLEDLAFVVELQIETDEKVFDKSQGR